MKAVAQALAVIGLVTGLFLRTAVVSPAFAQTPPPEVQDCSNGEFAFENPELCPTDIGGTTINYQDVRNAIDSPTPNLANTTAYIFYTISVILRGTVSTEANAGGAGASLIRPNNLSEATNQGGVIGGLAYLTGSLISNQPASAQTYIAYVASQSRFAGDQAYAQGVGFGALNPILGTWVAFRDVAYYLLILMFFVSGFLILIRHKISGQVAVTVQAVLPRLVLTLILITFSYAIAGFILDLMFIAIYFVISVFDGAIFKTGVPIGGADNLTDLALNTNVFEFAIRYIFSGGAWNAANALGEMVRGAIASALGEEFLLGLFGDGNLFEGLITIIFTLIFGIALLIATFRTFFALLMSYAGFVINVVLAPFILLPGVLPNNNAFGNWIKNLIAGVAPFVVAIFMIFLSVALTGGAETNQPGVGYRAGLEDNNITGLRLPLIMAGNIDISAFMGIVGMAFILLLPEAVNITKNLVGAKGGIFDQYKDKAVGAFQQGWNGSKYAPGLSGKNIVTGAGVGAIMGTAAAARSGQGKNIQRGVGERVTNSLGGGQVAAGVGRFIGGGSRVLATGVGGAASAALGAAGLPLYVGGQTVWKGTKGARMAFDKTATMVQETADFGEGTNILKKGGQGASTAPQPMPTPAPTGGGPATPPIVQSPRSGSGGPRRPGRP